MNKIGILTYHACLNFGACLQAYALQQSILKRHDDCEIINFQSEILRKINDVFCKYPTHLKEVIKNITRFPYYSHLKKRQTLFEDFINSNLKLSPRYSTEKEIETHAIDYDCIICGSDQIWNLDPKIRYESAVYYLNFPKKQKRITYATSFGSWIKDIADKEKEILPWIEEFDALSMREESGVNYLRSKELKCEWVLDPTFLLLPEEYDIICAEPLFDDQYVLLFSWDGAKSAVETAKIISKKLDCKIYNVIAPPRAMCSGIERKLDVGPKEFLSLVKNAKFIITNSFHGTVFSTIYEKPFISSISDSVDARRSSLMKQIGLEDHLMSPENISIDTIFNTDFSVVKNKISKLKESSLGYLYRSLI
jgi:polysaccharide pyruvyl transferase WcaK-like protein